MVLAEEHLCPHEIREALVRLEVVFRLLEADLRDPAELRLFTEIVIFCVEHGMVYVVWVLAIPLLDDHRSISVDQM